MMESFKKDLRSVLIANQHGVPMSQLNQRFFELTETRIQFDREKFSTLESFLGSPDLTDTVQLKRTYNDIICYGISSENQSNIQELIRGQKNSVPVRRTFQRPQAFASAGNRVFARRSHYNNRSFDSSDRRNQSFNRRNRFSSDDKENRPRVRGGRFSNDERTQRSDDLKTSNDSRSAPSSRRYNRGLSSSDDSNRSSNRDQRRSRNSDDKFKSESATKRTYSKDRSTNRKKMNGGPAYTNSLDIRTTVFDVDYKSELQQFVSENKLESPRYLTSKPELTKKDGKALNAYLANLHIGERSFLTFPTYYDSPEHAENAIAKIALDRLRCETASNCLRTTEQSTDANIINDLVKLFDEDDDSFRSTYLENKYFEINGQKLDSNWIEIVESSNLFSVDTVKSYNKTYHTITLIRSSAIDQDNEPDLFGPNDSNGSNSLNEDNNSSGTLESADYLDKSPGPDLIRDDNNNGAFESADYLDKSPGPDLIRDENNNDAFESADYLDKSPGPDLIRDDNNNGAFESADYSNESPAGRWSPAGLYLIRELPEELPLVGNKNWKVKVLNAQNGKLWLRLVENTADLVELLNRLGAYYMDRNQCGSVRTIIIDNIYVVLMDAKVFRAKVLKFVDEDLVRCFFLDDGIFENVSIDKLFEIEDEFIKLPFQAFQVELENLKDLDEESKLLLDKYIDYKMKEHNNSLSLIAKPISFDPTTVRLLYETEFKSHDTNLNEMISNFIKNSKSNSN